MLTAMKSAAYTIEPLSGSPSTSILAPVGVTTERVDPYTLQAIAGLFPTAGLDFLARLLRLAIVKQLVLAGTGQADVAEISVTSIRQLAALIGWSYDTTEKYVRLFCALGLLSKTREESLVVLRFALYCYPLPASLDRLDQLMVEGRPKVASFAKQVRRRFVRLYGDHHQETPTRELSTSGSSATEIQSVIRKLQQIMALPEAGALQKRLALLEKQLKEIDGRLGTQTVGSATEDSEKNGRLASEMVGSAASVDTKNGRLETEKSTKSPTKNGQNGRLGPETVGSTAKTVDSASSELSNVNVIIKTITDQINVNVSLVSAYFRERFDEPDSNNGFYHKLQKICVHPEVWLAAAIEVFVALQRQDDPLQKPGKYFFSRVCDMHKNGISPVAQELVQRYGEMSYAQLIAARRAPILIQQSEQARGQQSRPRLGAAVTLELRLERNRETSGMPLEEVEILRQAIRDEFSGWISKSYRQADGSCSLLVESSLRRQIWLYSQKSWKERLTTLIPPHQLTEMKNSISRNYHESREVH